MPTQRYSKWPDFVELTTDEDNKVVECVFVCVRKNSRAFQSDQINTLRALEHIAKVVVRVGTKDLTLEEFEQQGTFNNDIAPKMIAQSTYYNKRAELKRYEAQLRMMGIDDPGRDAIWTRVQRLRTGLGLAEEGAEMDKEFGRLERSQGGLNSLRENLAKAQTEGPRIELPPAHHVTLFDLTPEEVAKLTFSDLEKTGIVKNTPTWESMISRWVKCRQQLQTKGEQHVESKPVTAGQVDTPTKDGAGESTAVADVD